MGADRETKTTEEKMKRGNGSGTTMSLTSLCGGKTRPNGGKDTARTEPKKRDIIMATLIVLTVERKW